MIAALLSGRKDSKGVPNKNVYPILGRPLTWYPLAAAIHSQYIEKIYISTDSDEIAKIGTSLDAAIIARPRELATDKALIEDVIKHGFEYIKQDLNEVPELMVILLCNAATVLAENIDKGIEMLRADKTADSVATVTCLNQYNPIRAKKIVNGRLLPAVDLKQYAKPLTCDRGCIGDIYFCDASLWIIRPRCMDYSIGQPPFLWMGTNIIPIIQQGGLDVDDEEGIHATERWLRQRGFTKDEVPYR
ncbi:MAG: hypothetical protein A2987_06665 [Omnitrophica bacterium RIFCSPLOWO2_01_FULL_45_10]|nr:MAG: hypothetical protein A2987_06665 [Omnitrophica bacterium RIFCSPLOWO2_01_FULL_45_10]